MNQDYVELTFRNLNDKSKRFKCRVLGVSPVTSQRWLTMLSRALHAGVEIEKNYSWVGFPYCERNLDFLCSEINRHIDTINAYMETIPNPLFIKEKLDAEILFDGKDINRNLMNVIHHYFELMQGRVWEKNSEYFLNSNDETRIAIRELNNLCHEIELYVNSEIQRRSEPKYVCPSFHISFFVCDKIDLNYYDYQNFTLDRKFGNVYMHYCQAGKTHYEAFQDDDDVIFDSNISGLRLMSGEFDIDWGPTQDDSLDHYKEKKQRYAQWLEAKGWSIQDKSLGHGRLLVGQVDLADFADCIVDGEVDLVRAHKKLAEYQDVYSMRVVINNQITAERTFDYDWNDEKLNQIRLSILKPYYATYCNR
jgi:hypothetical protein